MLKEDTLEKIEDCTNKDCTICDFDKNSGYEKYKNYQKIKHQIYCYKPKKKWSKLFMNDLGIKINTIWF